MTLPQAVRPREEKVPPFKNLSLRFTSYQNVVPSGTRRKAQHFTNTAEWITWQATG